MFVIKITLPITSIHRVLVKHSKLLLDIFSHTHNNHPTIFLQLTKPTEKGVYKNMSTAAIMHFLSVFVWVVQCAGRANWKGLIDGFTVDCLSTSFPDETCQCKDTWMQQPVLHFLLLSSSLVRGRENDAVNTDAVCTVILGPAAFYLSWQLLLLLKSNARARGKS